MKKIYLLVLVLLTGVSSFAQFQCHSTEVSKTLRQQDPVYNTQMQQQEQKLGKLVSTGQLMNINNNPSRATRTIPVVVHVVYNTTAENVSAASIQQMIDIMNQDYRNQNPTLNTSSVRASFKALSKDAEIQFCLATRDLNGGATTGITRTTTTEADFDPDTETEKMKLSVANGGAGEPAWDPTKYLNIWICDLTGTQFGGVAGYAYLPTTGMHGSYRDGLVIDYQLGLGAANHTATHEIGHYLGLHHTWGDAASNACGNVFPNTDDGFSETPDSKEPNYGCTKNISCTNNHPDGDMYENYMDYSSQCMALFTTQQVAYMNNVLSTTRASLLTSQGCVSPGGPTAQFTANRQSICAGQTVTFTSTSLGSPTSYNWSFAGGTPSTSTSQNPTVTYSTAGTYGVTLTVSNGSGSNTKTETSYIVVASASASALPLVEGFESSTFPPTGWVRQNDDADTTWKRTTSASGFGTSTASAFINNISYDAAGQKDWLITPAYNFTGASAGRIKFDYAYTRYYDATNGYFDDTLQVLYSTDCGTSWVNLWKKGGAALSTTTPAYSSNSFVPTATQWKKDSVSLASLSGQTNVKFAFVNITGYGNNVFLDNVNIYNAGPITVVKPVADFVGTPTTVVVGNTVAFTDLSTNTPTSWSWSFAGGTPATSTAQNPTITYNTVGTYAVTLTSSNSGGTSTAVTKTAYITVINAAVGCDTLSNVTNADTLGVYPAPGTWGYVSGHNGYGDLGKAEKYSSVPANQKVTGAIFYFARARSVSGTGTITAKVWDNTGTGGAPGTALASVSVPISTLTSNLNTGNPTFVSFPTQPSVGTTFYVGFEMTYAAGDTVALVTTTVNSPSVGQGWEKQSNGAWYEYANAASFSAEFSNVVFPVICGSGSNAAVANFTAGKTVVCAGESVTFTDQSSNTPTSWSWSFGGGGTPNASSLKNPSIVFSTPGTYTVSLSASNASGSNTATKTAYITVKANPVATATSVAAKCFGQASGSAAITVTSGTSPYTYLWSDATTQSSISNKASGSYTVTVKDANQCADTVTVSISQPLSALTATASSNDAICSQSNGSVSALGSGGSGGFTYIWNTGATTQAVSNLLPGTYNVTIKDVNNCTATASATIGNQPSNITVSITTTPTTCGKPNGTATAVANNGGGGISNVGFVWNNGKTTSLLDSLASGTYTVTVTNNVGCTATASGVVNSQVSNFSVAVTTTPATCGKSNGVATANITNGGGGTITYLWNTAENTASINNLGSGTYSVTATNSAGCTATSSAAVNNTPIGFSVSATSTAANCGNPTGSVTATVTGTGSFTYLWNNNQTTPTVNNVVPGLYTVTVTSTSGCTLTASTTVANQTGGFAVSVATTGVSCNKPNGTATATVTNSGGGNVTYLWNNNETVSTIDSLPVGTYTVTVTNSAGCSVSASGSVGTQTGTFSVVVNTVDALCNKPNGSAAAVVSNGSGAVTYLWSNNQTSATINNLAPGTYTVTATNNVGCSVTASNVVNNQVGSFSIGATATASTCGNANGSATAFVTNGGGTVSYLWNTNQTTATIINLSAGTYTVTATNDIGCEASATAVVNAQAANFSASVATVNTTCGNSNGSATVSVTNTGGGTITYLWNTGQTAASLTSLASGTYTVTASNSLGCTATASGTIASSSALSVSATSVNATCGNNNGSVTTAVTNGTGNISYLWNTNATTASISNLAGGTYTVTATSAAGCSATASASVTAQPVDFTVTVTTVDAQCGVANGTATAAVTNTGSGNVSLLWNTGDNTTTIDSLVPGTYTVTATNSNGCTVVATSTLNNVSNLAVTLSGTNPSTPTATDGQVTSSVAGGTPPYTYSWSTSSTLGSINNLAGGIFTLTVTDNAGCIKIVSDTLVAPTTIGISEASLAVVKVYPNPASDIVKIEIAATISSDLHIRLTDVAGRLLQSVQKDNYKTGTEELNIAQLAFGTYFVEVSTGNSFKTIRIIKQ